MQPWCLALVACTGCHVVLGLGDKPDANPDASLDATFDAGRDELPRCPDTGIFDTFDGGSPCAPWGTADLTNDSMIQTGSGTLSITPAGGAPSYGGCTASSLTTLGSFGVVLEVSQVVTDGYVVLHAYPETSEYANPALVARDGMLSLYADNTFVANIPYDAATTRFWRLRADSQGMLGEYSANGRDWVFLGRVAGDVASSVLVNFGAGTDEARPGAGTAHIEQVSACPDGD